MGNMQEGTARSDAGVADIRGAILADPGLILEDRELMRALLKAERSGLGRNVVDLRAVLVDRLEERLDRLEDTHREVIAAAYENVAGTNQVQRACLALLDVGDFAAFLRLLEREMPAMLGVEVVRLAIEAPAAAPGQGLGPQGRLQDTVVALPAGGVAAYVTRGRGLGPRPVTLRRHRGAATGIYGGAGAAVRSEALMVLDLGPGNLAGLLALGSSDPDRFQPDQGTDLLGFFGAVFERSVRRWLE